MNVPPSAQQRNIIFALGSLLLGSYDITEKVRESFSVHGDMYRIRFKSHDVYVIRHPDHIQQVLVTDAAIYHKDPDYSDPKKGLAKYLGYGLLTSDGEFWQKQRKLIQPAFHHKRIEGYADIMTAFAEQQSATWREGATLSVSDAMMNLTMAIVVKALFDTEMASEASMIAHALEVMQSRFIQTSIVPEWIPTPAGLQEPKVVATFDEIVYRLIQERRADGTDRGDLLSMLLAALDDEGNPMSDKQIRDEAITLILAGHETTANVMAWTWYLLSQNPAVEATLHRELDTVLGGRTPVYADFRALPYTDMVVKEAMRLYPPAYFIGRMAIEDTRIGDFDVPKGTQIGIATFATHRDERWWDQPDAFIPERWAEERERPKYAYLPFGAGPRVCIGNSFAMIEARLLLATLAQRFRFRLPMGTTVRTDPLITLRPKGGLKMKVERRDAEHRTQTSEPATAYR